MKSFVYSLQTETEGFYNITGSVRRALTESQIRDGICVVFCPHTTAGITINENADPDVVKDLLFALKETFPDRAEFCHAEGNSAAHLKASYMGSSATDLVEDGHLVLGTWQGIYFCEFDGPRTRKYFVKFISMA